MNPCPSPPAWHALAAEAALAALRASPQGLAPEEAAARLARDGRNELPPPPKRSALARLLRRFHNVLIYVLLAAGANTVLLGHLTDAGVIFGVALVNAIVGDKQEGKAERALKAVRAMLAATAIVLRGGQRREVAAAELVAGDVVLPGPGDRVPTNLRLLREKNLEIDEAVLTGDSVPVEKAAAAVAADAPPAEPLITRLLLFRLAYVTVLMIAAAFFVFERDLARGVSLEAARTATVNMLVIGELVYLFNCRRFVASSLDWSGLTGNPVALAVAAPLLALQLLLTCEPTLQALFATAPLDAAAWALILALALAKFLAVEAEKALLRRLGVVRL